MLNDAELGEAAALLEGAAARLEPIEPLTDRWPELDQRDAYTIQARTISRRVAGGARRVGWKIGLTSAAMQEQLGVDEPDFGPLLDDMDLAGKPCPNGRLIEPRVEGEIAFVMRDGLEGAGLDLEAVLAATERVVPAIEVIDSRIAAWRIKLADTIADHASAAAFQVGGPGCGPRDHDLAAMEMSLKVDGDEVDSGVGAAVLGHPANALIWLAETLAPLGERILPGDLVLAGALTASVPARPGALVEADFGPALGTVTIRFEPKVEVES